MPGRRPTGMEPKMLYKCCMDVRVLSKGDGTFLPTQFCPQSFCPHFAHTIIKTKSKFGVHIFVNKQDFRGLGDFLWAKCVGKMKMCGQNENMKRAAGKTTRIFK